MIRTDGSGRADGQMSMTAPDTPAAVVVRRFLEVVRSGRQPDDAHHYMADRVLAHQLTGEHESTIRRTPAEYADHVRAMLIEHGNFTLETLTFVASDDLVAVTWRQIGEQPPTGRDTTKPVTELAACTYRVDSGRIVEYWLLIDRFGIEYQLAA